MLRNGTPRLSLRTTASVARKLERSLCPGSMSRTQSFSCWCLVSRSALDGAGGQAETMRRWKIRTSITSGTVTTTAAAACAP